MPIKDPVGRHKKIYRSLCHVLSERADQVHWDEFAPTDWDLFSQMADREGVAPLMYWKLKDSPIKVPPSTFNLLRSTYYQTLAQNTLIYQEIERILKVLDEARIPVIVLKGAALAVTVYEDIGLRPMSDIDILVPRHSIEEAERIVGELGYTENLPHGIPEIWKRTSYCSSLEKHVGLNRLQMEIHWGLVAGDTDWRSPSLDWFYQQTEAIRISQQTDQSGSRHLILSPVAHLLYLSAHLMLKHGGSQARLIWLYDLHLLICHFRSNLDFRELFNVARDYRWTPALEGALHAINSCFNTYLPSEMRTTNSAPAESDSRRMVQRKKQSLQTRTLNVWDRLVSLGWNTRFRLILGLLFPHPSYMRWRYALAPKWLWPLSYPYRWIDIIKNVVLTSLNLIRERLSRRRNHHKCFMFSRLISGDPRSILKSDRVIWLLLLLLTSVIVFSSFMNSWGRNLAHIYLSKLIGNSPYSCVIVNTACKNDSIPNQIDLETWRNLGIYLRNDPVLIIIPRLGEFADVDYYESEIATYSDRTDLAWLAFGVKAYQHELINQAIESWKNVPEISHYLINLSQNTDNMSLSIELLKLALDVQPSGIGYYELCNRLLENEQREAASVACQQALPFAGVEENLDLRAKIYMRLGDIFLRLGNPKDALNSYIHAQELIGEMPAWDTMRLAQAHFRLGRLDEASQILRDLLVEHRDMISVYWLLGEVERQRGNTAEALKAYREYQQYRPEDDRVYRRLKELEER